MYQIKVISCDMVWYMLNIVWCSQIQLISFTQSTHHITYHINIRLHIMNIMSHGNGVIQSDDVSRNCQIQLISSTKSTNHVTCHMIWYIKISTWYDISHIISHIMFFCHVIPRVASVFVRDADLNECAPPWRYRNCNHRGCYRIQLGLFPYSSQLFWHNQVVF